MSRETGQPKIQLVRHDEWNDVDPEWEARQRTHNAKGEPYRQAIGVDLGYTENGGDYTSIVPVAAVGRLFYVRDLIRCRRDVIVVRSVLAGVQHQYPGAEMVSYISGPEKAVLALLAEEHVDERSGQRVPAVYVNAMLAKFPKPVRSQRTAEMWNEGRIVVPPTRHWTGGFVERMKAFTGAPKQDDGDTDALVSAIDYLDQTAPAGQGSTGAFGRTRV